jgi:seryl-tRNA synthetase
MLDPKLIRQDIKETAKRLRVKGFDLDTQVLLSLEEKRKSVQVETEELQAKRNSQSKAIGKAKSQGEDIQPLLDEVADLGEKLDQGKQQLDAVQSELHELMLAIPNVPDASVPEGASEEDNVEVRRWGDPTDFDFEPKDHVDLTDTSGLMSFETAVRIAGSRFVTLRGAMARMHRALTQFMLDVHTGEHGYEEIYVPYIVNSASLLGTG